MTHCGGLSGWQVLWAGRGGEVESPGGGGDGGRGTAVSVNESTHLLWCQHVILRQIND